MENSVKQQGIFYAILAALLYGLSAPLSKLLLVNLSPLFMAALLYLGAGIGMLILNIIKSLRKKASIEAKLTIEELPYIIGMILLDIVAPILLMTGLTLTNASTVSLLNNFEIVATSIIAILIFNEGIEKRLWIAIVLITIASVILSFNNFESLSISLGAMLVISATILWGLENNFTRMLSLKDPMQVVIIKGFGSGVGSLIIALSMQVIYGGFIYILMALILGIFSYGFSIFFYVSAQRYLGASKTSAFFASAPFIGVLASWIILRESLSLTFYIGLAVMLLGSYFAVTENHRHNHEHHLLEQTHRHRHNDGHHNHNHDVDEHVHLHTHKPVKHSHEHSQDMHHRHTHD